MSVEPENQNISVSESEKYQPSNQKHQEEPIYECPDCGKIFDNPRSLSAHRLKVHRVKPSYLDSGRSKKTKKGEPPPTTVELPAPQKDPYISALEEENRRLKTELQNALLQSRLSKYQTPDLVTQDPLIRLKYAQLLDVMAKEQEQRLQTLTQPKRDSDNSQIAQAYESRISELQKEIATLKDELNRKELQALQEKVKELKDELREVREQAVRGQSDLTAIVSTLSKHIENATDRLETAIMAYGLFGLCSVRYH